MFDIVRLEFIEKIFWLGNEFLYLVFFSAAIPLLCHLHGKTRGIEFVGMAEQYEFTFFENPLSVEDVRLKVPASCLHPLTNCHSSRLFKFNGAQMHRQQFFLEQFHAELLQLDSEVPFHFKYRILQNQLFILFCLEGEISFTTLEGKVMTVARKGYFYVSRNNRGTYNVHCRKKGITLIFAVSISQKWAMKKAKNYPHLKEALCLLLESKRQFGVMPHCEINEDVPTWFRFLQRFANFEKRSFGRMLKSLVGNALKFYEDLLKKRNTEPIQKVKRYIDRNFCDSSLTVQRLSEIFPIEERTLRKKFVMEFHTTPTNYLTMLRLREAKRLIEEKAFPRSEVWQWVGYNDPETFRQGYTKFEVL